MTNHLSQFAKQAVRQTGDPMNDRLIADAQKKLMLLLGGGLALGGAARGGMGLLNLARRNAPQPAPSKPLTLGIPDEEEDLKYAEDKQASGGRGQTRSWPMGGDAKNLMQIPWFPPAAMAAGLGGIYGGWNIFDKLMDERRESEQEQELENAKLQFSQALQGPTGAKTAGDNELGRELDGLFDEIKQAMENDDLMSDLTKSANWGGPLGQAAGLYGIYALLAGGMAGNYAYNRAKKRTGPKVLEEAMKRRKRQRAATRPAPVLTAPFQAPPKDEKEEKPQAAPTGMLGFDGQF
jgi:hypothetical protein